MSLEASSSRPREVEGLQIDEASLQKMLKLEECVIGDVPVGVRDLFDSSPFIIMSIKKIVCYMSNCIICLQTIIFCYNVYFSYGHLIRMNPNAGGGWWCCSC